MKHVRKAGFFLFAALFILLLILCPPWAKGASAVYLPLAFFSIALFLSSGQYGLTSGLDYLRPVPEKGRLPWLFAWGIIALVSIGALTLFLSGIMFTLGMLDTAPVKAKILSLPLFALISSFTLAPLGEEAFFRGFLFRKLGSPAYKGAGNAKNAGPSSARQQASLRSVSFPGSSWIFSALISSLFFALLHFAYGSVAEVIVAFCIGLLLCAFTYHTRSLIPAVVAHAGFNFFSVGLSVLCFNFGCPF